MVPEVGIEPTLSRGKGDFESPASTSFTTPARRLIILRCLDCQEKCIDKTSHTMIAICPLESGVVAQLGERLNGIQEVASSILASSTREIKGLTKFVNPFFLPVLPVCYPSSIFSTILPLPSIHAEGFHFCASKNHT